MIDLPITDEMIDKVEDPIQREFFRDIKKRVDSGEKLNGFNLLDSVGELMGAANPDSLARMQKMNEILNELTKPFQNIKV